MVGTEFFGDVDLASVAIWMFWVFFALLIYYLQTENQREGYPLRDDDGSPSALPSVFPVPRDKTFILRDGRGTVSVPSQARNCREDLALARSSVAGGYPYIPTGDPMKDGVGPASWAPRRDVPELDAHGHAKIRPMSKLPDFAFSAGRDPRGLAVMSRDGEVVGRVIDMMIDASEAIVRYLVVDLNPEGSGNTRLLPMGMVLVRSDRVLVKSLNAAHFEDIPRAASEDQVTLLEEDKIMGYVGGGTLYAREMAGDDVARAQPAE